MGGPMKGNPPWAPDEEFTMSDEQDRAEALDEEQLGDEYPPERPIGIDGEDVSAEDVGRIERSEKIPQPPRDRVELIQRDDDDHEMLGDAVEDPPNDDSMVDTDDTADPSERLGDADQSAEEAAIHLAAPGQ